MVQQFDFLVIGSGIAGMSLALKVADKGKVAIICKTELEEANTYFAQGGIASVGVGTLFGVLYLAVPAFSGAVAGIFTGPAIPATLVALAAEVIVSLCTKKEEMSEEERLALVVESRGAVK